MSGAGVFRDAGTDERARQIFFDGEMPAFQVIIPDFGVVEGPFQITAIEYAGSFNGEATYELTLASAGAGAGQQAEAVAPQPAGGEPELVGELLVEHEQPRLGGVHGLPRQGQLGELAGEAGVQGERRGGGGGHPLDDTWRAEGRRRW